MTSKNDPTQQQRVTLANVMEGKAVCVVSSRWLQFPQTATMVYDAPFMFVDVMTMNSDDQEKKICQLVLSKDDLLQILNRIEIKE
jgi:hypothetical protein